MAKHERKVHNIIRLEENKNNKKARLESSPMPKPSICLLKAPDIETSEPIMSQKDMNDICAKSANSALKDLASLFDSEDVFSNETVPKTDLDETTQTSDNNVKSYFNKDLNRSKNSVSPNKSVKSASFFDLLKEKLMNDSGKTTNLTCQYCGHESKCLTESVTHQKSCGTEEVSTEKLPQIYVSSTRCQYCRQRCKSSADLFNHLQKCPEAMNIELVKRNKYQCKKNEESAPSYEKCFNNELLNKEDKTVPHPMENKVFIWNNIEVPMEVDCDDKNNQYDYVDDKQDNVSLDLSVRTASPNSEVSFVSVETNPTVNTSSVTEKIPTHGTDISVAQHKRVFKCPHCSFWASTASRFHVHIVGHLNKKPFECSLCAYRSNWRWDITKHIKLKSVRDPAHENAKVLMTDETGRRNYTKYNKYITEIHVSGDHTETSGGSGTRPKTNYDSLPSQNKAELPKSPNTFNNSYNTLRNSNHKTKVGDSLLFSKLTSEKRSSSESNKKTLWKCKKCNFK